MIDTAENKKATEKEWEELFIKDKITDEEAMSSKYDYLDEDED